MAESKPAPLTLKALAADLEALRRQVSQGTTTKPLPAGLDAGQEERIAALTAQVQSLEHGLKALQDEVDGYLMWRGWK